MGETYSTRKQESTYQPWRVRVGDGEQGGYRFSRYRTYGVYVVNTVTHEAERIKGDIYSKGDAVALAKETAQARGLPFNARLDVVPEVEILHGPARACVGCGAPVGRGREPALCAACTTALALGRAQLAETKRWRVWYESLLPHYARAYWEGHADSEKLLLALLRLAGLPGEDLEPYQRGVMHQVDGVLGETGDVYRGNYVDLPLSAAQFAALAEVWERVRAAVQEANRDGQQHGSSLIEKLAAGEIHPNDFAAARDRPPETKALRVEGHAGEGGDG